MYASTTKEGSVLAKLTSDSFISISLAIVLVTGASWITIVYASGVQNDKAISRLEARQEQYEAQLRQVNEKLATIQGMLLRQ